MLDPKLLAIIVCPKCRGELTEAENPPALICERCRSIYPIRDNIPILLIDEATSMDAE